MSRWWNAKKTTPTHSDPVLCWFEGVQEYALGYFDRELCENPENPTMWADAYRFNCFAQEPDYWRELPEQPDQPRESQIMADGKGRTCCAYYSGECACDADWTPQEIIDLRKENKEIKERLLQLSKMYKTKARHVDNLLKQKRTNG